MHGTHFEKMVKFWSLHDSLCFCLRLVLEILNTILNADLKRASVPLLSILHNMNIQIAFKKKAEANALTLNRCVTAELSKMPFKKTISISSVPFVPFVSEHWNASENREKKNEKDQRVVNIPIVVCTIAYGNQLELANQLEPPQKCVNPN